MSEHLNRSADDRTIHIDERYAHAFDVSPAEARELQQQLRRHVRIADEHGQLKTVAGLDVGFEGPARGRSGWMRAAVAVLDMETLELTETAVAREPTRFPYVPGLLSFREVPALLAALARLSAAPDLLACDGHGYAHPRRLGIACHLGLLTGLPTLGIAKSRLVGEHGEVPQEKGSHLPLVDAGEVIGSVLRSRTGTKPLYVSPGHRVSMAGALALAQRLVGRYRQPETTRAAHHLASVAR